MPVFQLDGRSRMRFRAALAFGALFTPVTGALGQFDARGGEASRVDRDQPTSATRGGARRDWLLSLEGVTNAPVDIGGRITAETPFRGRLAAGFGVVPGMYLSLINSVVSGAGAYDDRTAGIVAGSFEGGSAFRAQLGFRPFPRSGFYVDGGYSLVRLSGNVYGSDVAPAASNVVIDGTAVRDAGYRVDTTMHLWLLELGYQAHVRDRLVLGLGLGVMGTIAAHTSADPNFAQGRTSRVRAISDSVTQDIDDVLESYGYVPTLTLRVGYDVL